MIVPVAFVSGTSSTFSRLASAPPDPERADLRSRGLVCPRLFHCDWRCASADRCDLDEWRRKNVQLLERFLEVLCGFRREKRYGIRCDFHLGRLRADRSESRSCVGGIREVRPARNLLLDDCDVSSCHASHAVVVEAMAMALLHLPPRLHQLGVFLALYRLRRLDPVSPCSAASPSVLGRM